jgi:hypothetical protein
VRRWRCTGAEQLSYEEIAVRMGTSSGSVAQLISRARINLYDELRGTALASVAPPSPECEQALPLIAAREDGQPEAVSGDPAWLDAHLAGCERCRLGLEQMHEAEAAYRAGAPIEPLGEPPFDTEPAAPPAPGRFRLSRSRVVRLPPRRAALIGASAALLLLAGLAAAFAGDDGAQSPATPAADAASGRDPGEAEHGAKSSRPGGEKGAAKTKARKQGAAAETNGSGATAAGATPTQVTVPPGATAGGDAQGERPSRPTSGRTGVKPTQQISTPKPKPPPTAAPTSQPATGPTTPATEAPPAEEPSDAPGRSGEAPGKPPGHPRH